MVVSIKTLPFGSTLDPREERRREVDVRWERWTRGKTERRKGNMSEACP